MTALLHTLIVDASSPMPAYYQLYEALRAQLGGETLPAGSKLPTERSIAEATSVSRQTVRRALSRLEREGLVYRRQGDGTYVSEPRVESSLRFLRGFTTEISGRGMRVRSRVLELRLAQPPQSVAAALGVPVAQDTAIMLRRTRLLDGVPATLETVWLQAELCRPILAINMTDRSLYATLRTLIGVEPKRATERLTATALDEFEAKQLGQKIGSPALLVERTTTDADGRCIEVVKSVLRADRFAFHTELDIEHESVTEPALLTAE